MCSKFNVKHHAHKLIVSQTCNIPTTCVAVVLQQSDLVDLDLEELYEKSQAELPKPTGLRDSTEFVSELLLIAAKKGHRFCQYYIGRCFEQGIQWHKTSESVSACGCALLHCESVCVTL